MSAQVSVSQAVVSRRSVRGFLDTPVDAEVVKSVLAAAARAPSGGNVQPWHLYLVGGEPLVNFKAKMQQTIQALPGGEPMEYDIYPANMPEPYRSYRFQVGEALYGAVGIGRDNKFGRLMWFARNYQFFGAPLALFSTIDRRMGPPQWSDLGMYLQTVMLLLREQGLDSCAQECWARYPLSVAALIQSPPEQMLFCGMAIGYRDPEDPSNNFPTERAPLADFCTTIGV
jgi:nitroreductase